MTWQNAKQACQAIDSHLMKIDNEDEELIIEHELGEGESIVIKIKQIASCVAIHATFQTNSSCSVM